MLRVLMGVLVCAALAGAGDVHGSIAIEKKLTRHNVTAAAGLYQRGPAVDLGADVEEDPIAFERSHVAVYLEGPKGGSNGVPAKVVVQMEQKDRRFVPDLIVIPAGAAVSFPNFDPIFHNVFSLSKARSFDLGNYPKGQTRTVTFPGAGVVAVYCHLHPNMAASIVVTPSQWGTLADRSGSFALKDVPAGTYTVVAWHKSAGFFRKTVELGAANDAEVNFVLPYVEPGAHDHVAQR
jgi:plastocyanin